MRIRHNAIIMFAMAFSLVVASCNGRRISVPCDTSAWKGILINEIAAHDQTLDAETWVELLNNTSREIDLSGLGLYLTDVYFTGQCIWKAPAGTCLGPGMRLVVSTRDGSLVTGISSSSQFVLKLATEDGSDVDCFDRNAVFAEPAAAFARGSYQRLPDGATIWRNLTYHSRGRENVIFSLERYRNSAFWAWSTHVSDLMADDGAQLKALKMLGYDHIILNYAAFEDYNAKNTISFLEKCEELDINVHVWMQCFYKNGSWISPVDDENKCYREDLYADIQEHARHYLEDFGVKGLHLDYIRFGGTASEHNISAEVNAVGAVNRCCREIREITDGYREGLLTSAALMPEPDTEYAYGQNPSSMGKYIHILMPMCYRYTYGWNDARCKALVDWFVSNGGGAQVWPGITTYTGNDSSGVQGMDAADIRRDIDVFLDSKAQGIVLFRYGLGSFPNVTDLNRTIH